MESGGFDTHIVFHSIPFLAKGMLLTLVLTVLGIAGGLVFGTLLALMRLSNVAVPVPYLRKWLNLSFLAGSYVNFFRSMPLILVIFWFYFLIPLLVGEQVGAFQSVLTAFIMFEAAYYCEIMRAGIQSVKVGQAYAGEALGLCFFPTDIFLSFCKDCSAASRVFAQSRSRSSRSPPIWPSRKLVQHPA